MDTVRIVLRRNALGLIFLAIFALSLVGQSIAGHADYNNDAIDHSRLTGEPADKISYLRYLVSSDFGQAVMENWQSEWLQFVVFLMVTVWLTQRGSAESKVPGEEGLESEEEQKLGEHAGPDSPRAARRGPGALRWLYENSLLLVMGAFFAGSWFAQSVTGWSAYNSEQLSHEGDRLSWLQYVGSSDFWQTTLQNWQSEFLAVGAMVVLSIYLRQRGSPQAKPVGDPHTTTATEG